MTDVHSEKADTTLRVYLGSIGGYGVGSLLVTVAHALLTRSTKQFAISTFLALFRFGYSLTLITDIDLIGIFDWLLFKTPSNGTADLGRKRRELVVLDTHTIMMFISDLCSILFSTYAGYAFLVLFLGVGLYPRVP
jgi:hypothetical protein